MELAQTCFPDNSACRTLPLESEISNHHVKLTEKGIADAYEFGKQLIAYPMIRLFHSPAVRCLETAKAVAEGADQIGVEVITNEEDHGLSWTTCILDEACWSMAEHTGYDFIKKWLTGKIDHKLVRSIAAVSNEMSDNIVQRLAEDDSSELLDINISHDWNIMALRERYLNMCYEKNGWIGYLDGLSFFPFDGSITLAYGIESIHL